MAARPKKNAETAAPAPSLDVPKLKGKLFPGKLPLEPQATPQGLQGSSAQVCHACHPVALSQWEQSAHARGPSRALREAAVGEPGCLTCHLPLAEQWDGPWPDAPQPDGNPAFDATLQLESVTCAACHVREGDIIVGTEAAAARPMPHPSRFSDRLSSSEACAACHQLSLPGMEQPLYDTWGEWKRSGFEAAGITCQACHATGAADGTLGVDHRMAADPARAITIELDLPTLKIVRGGPPVPLAVTVHNTGAGHHFPTGTPFRGMRLSVVIEGPEEVPGVPRTAGSPVLLDLQRRIEPTFPFALLEDSTLPPGGSRKLETTIALPADAPAGPWTLRITMVRTLQGRDDGAAFIDRRWSLAVE